MAKQSKIGFDFSTFPLKNVYVPLFDLLTGETLKDLNNFDILTEIKEFQSEFFLSKHALPVTLNVEKTLSGIKPLNIEEIFPQSSEVSTTLLGVRRAEEQLSLFADVSTYGLDEDNWEFETFSGFTNFPLNWYERKHPFLQNRNRIRFVEGTEEQALYLEAFPVNYSFPFGPRWKENGYYNQQLFEQYLNFVAFGKILYEFYSSRGFESYARKNFISDKVKIFQDDSNSEIIIDETSIQNDGSLENRNLYYDVIYDENEEEAFFDIEKFTLTFLNIENNQFTYLRPTTFTENDNNTLNQIIFAINLTRDQMRPGYSTGRDYVGELYSKQTFRYQPGRISGFTFGIRLNIDNTSESNICEWGISNNTDEYVFQLKGSSFNIIRRSKIPLPSELLRRMNLQATETTNYQTQVRGKGVDNSEELWELTIPRDKFNGDSLDGNGPSGYILSFEDVTMFKIEFGWYGAIGAKFYAYIPINNDQARWILVHTLVIENGLQEPCLVDPNFRFKYLLNINDTQRIREPSFIYKYGASYYIDGGDEGTKKISSIYSNPKSYFDETSFFGIHPKKSILNSRGTSIENSKEVYPTEISCFSETEYYNWFLSNDEFNPTNIWIDDIPLFESVFLLWGSESGGLKQWGDESGLFELWGDEITNVEFSSIDEDFYQINVKEIQGSPDGKHFHYSTSLHNTINPSTSNVNFTVETNLSEITTSGYNLSTSDLKSKVIADGIYNTFVGDIQNFRFNISRRNRYELETKSLSTTSESLSGDTIQLSGQSFDGKIVKYDTVAASQIPLSSDFVKIHFLNPNARDEDFPRHFAEFALGFTNKKPKKVLDGLNEVLKFGDANENIDMSLDQDIIFTEYVNFSTRFNLRGEESSEWDPTAGGSRFNIDYRLPDPLGEDSGEISAIILEVETIDVEFSSVQVDEANSSNYRVNFSSNPGILSSIAGNGFEELGINNQKTGITFQSTLQEEIDSESGEIVYYILVSDDISNSENKFQIKTVTITNDWQVESYDENGNFRFPNKVVFVRKILSYDIQPLYLIVGMKDYAKINNIIIEQVFNNESFTYTPNFLTDDLRSNVIINSGGSFQEFPPANFKSDNRLTGYSYDEQNLQPLRPGKTISSYVLRTNEINKINFENVFDYDRKKITPGILNNKAIYFTAKSLANTSAGKIEASLTLREI